MAQRRQVIKRCLLTLCLASCGSTAVSSTFDASYDSTVEASVQDNVVPDLGSIPDVSPSPLVPCVTGNWFIRFVPWSCPLCVFCHLYHIPLFYTTKVSDTLQIMNCQMTLVSVENTHRCTYQSTSTCVPTLTFDDGQAQEEFNWNGNYGNPSLNDVVFQKFTGELTVAVVNGQVLGEYFVDQEIGFGGLMIGLDAGFPCGVMILLTKEDQ